MNNERRQLATSSPAFLSSLVCLSRGPLLIVSPRDWSLQNLRDLISCWQGTQVLFFLFSVLFLCFFSAFGQQFCFFKNLSPKKRASRRARPRKVEGKKCFRTTHKRETSSVAKRRQRRHTVYGAHIQMHSSLHHFLPFGHFGHFLLFEQKTNAGGRGRRAKKSKFEKGKEKLSPKVFWTETLAENLALGRSLRCSFAPPFWPLSCGRRLASRRTA